MRAVVRRAEVVPPALVRPVWISSHPVMQSRGLDLGNGE
jgi:hypothetical protein